MGQTHGGGSGSWRQETVTSAGYYTRPTATSGSGPGDHHGVVVGTKEGNSYLIHHPGPGSTTTVTPSSNMSSKWTKTHDIPVSSPKSVQEVYNSAGGRTTNPIVNYVTAKTCIGAAKGAESALNDKK